MPTCGSQNCLMIIKVSVTLYKGIIQLLIDNLVAAVTEEDVLQALQRLRLDELLTAFQNEYIPPPRQTKTEQGLNCFCLFATDRPCTHSLPFNELLMEAEE